MWSEAMEQLQKYGTIVKSPTGFPIQSPYMAIANRQAELMMLKRKGREHPFFWASFIQSGDWRPLDVRR